MRHHAILVLLFFIVITSGCISSSPSIDKLTEKSETSSFKTTYSINDTHTTDLPEVEAQTSVNRMEITSWVKKGELVKQTYHPPETGSKSIDKETKFAFYYPKQESDPESYLLCGGKEKGNCETRTNYPPRLLSLVPINFPLLEGKISSKKLNSKGVRQFGGEKCQFYSGKELQKPQKILGLIGSGYKNRLDYAKNINLQICLTKSTGAVLFSNVTAQGRNSKTEIAMKATSYTEEYPEEEIEPPKPIK